MQRRARAWVDMPFLRLWARVLPVEQGTRWVAAWVLSVLWRETTACRGEAPAALGSGAGTRQRHGVGWSVTVPVPS